MDLRQDALTAAKEAIKAMLPEQAVKEALNSIRGRINSNGKIILIAIGKAAWRMANAAYEELGAGIARGTVITKDGHSMGKIAHLNIFETGHPVPDARTIAATEAALDMTSELNANDTVIFLISGGGSALFEKPLPNVSLDDIADVTRQLLACGANIVEINAIRKHLSAVKGGRFAQHCFPAHVEAIVLSDVLGDRLDSIASGPACPDASTVDDVRALINKYDLKISLKLLQSLQIETPKHLDNVTTSITGSCNGLCAAAQKYLEGSGYKTLLLTTTLSCEAREAGSFFASMAKEVIERNSPIKAPCAIIAGGETIVHLKGKGKGGRNQEMALSAAIGIQGINNAVFLSVGSDGTDGPTDAAGGLADGGSVARMAEKGVNAQQYLDDNNAYNALAASNDLIITSPTGTNVNDVSILLCR